MGGQLQIEIEKNKINRNSTEMLEFEGYGQFKIDIQMGFGNRNLKEHRTSEIEGNIIFKLKGNF